MYSKILLAAVIIGVSYAQDNPGGGSAMMRFACSQLVVERLDPLVNPGVIGTPHVHQIVGGNSFKASMTPVAYDLPSRSNCTSCTFSEYVTSLPTSPIVLRLTLMVEISPTTGQRLSITKRGMAHTKE
jgi:hypothetical protein